jgi:hypothetical protein
VNTIFVPAGEKLGAKLAVLVPPEGELPVATAVGVDDPDLRVAARRVGLEYELLRVG